MLNHLKKIASVRYADGLHARLRKAQHARDYLAILVEEGDTEGVLLALRDIAEAKAVVQR